MIVFAPVVALIVLPPAPVAVTVFDGAEAVFEVPAVRLFEPVVAAMALLPVVAVILLPVPPVRLFWVEAPSVFAPPFAVIVLPTDAVTVLLPPPAVTELLPAVAVTVLLPVVAVTLLPVPPVRLF